MLLCLLSPFISLKSLAPVNEVCWAVSPGLESRLVQWHRIGLGLRAIYFPMARSSGEKQWRVPLALQVPWGIILLVGLSTFMPDSPRQLARNGKVEVARVNFDKIHRGFPAEEAQHEFDAMRAQTEFEMSRELTSW